MWYLRGLNSVEEFITVLYSLMEKCNYNDLKNKMLSDRIIVGPRDGAMSEKLQMDPGLTLEIAKKRVR